MGMVRGGLSGARKFSNPNIGNGLLVQQGLASPKDPTILPPIEQDIVLAVNSGWTNASGVTVTNTATFPVAHKSGRTSGLRLQKPTSAFGGARTTTISTPNFKLSDFKLIGLDVFGVVTSGSVTIRFSSDNFETKRVEFIWSFPNYFINGWQRLTVRPDDDGSTAEGGQSWIVTGGQTLDEPINAIQISLSTAAGVALEVYVDRIIGLKKVPSRGAVMLGLSSFGEQSVVSQALPILNYYNIKSYWAGDGNLAEGVNIRERLDTWYSAGHDLIQQGRNHTNYVEDSSTLSSDFDATKAYFRSMGWTRGEDFFVTPFSTTNDTVEAILASKGVKMAKGGSAASLKPSQYHPIGFKLIGHGGLNIGGLTLAQVKKLVDQCVVNGTIKNLFCHGLVDGGTGTSPPSDTNFWYVEDFRELCRYIASYVATRQLDADSPSILYAKRMGGSSRFN